MRCWGFIRCLDKVSFDQTITVTPAEAGAHLLTSPLKWITHMMDTGFRRYDEED
jgi:hypothetical protein